MPAEIISPLNSSAGLRLLHVLHFTQANFSERKCHREVHFEGPGLCSERHFLCGKSNETREVHQDSVGVICFFFYEDIYIYPEKSRDMLLNFFFQVM